MRNFNKILILCLSIFLLTRNITGTELHLRFRDQSGYAVNLSKAELLLAAWGEVEVEWAAAPNRISERAATQQRRSCSAQPVGGNCFEG